MRVLNPFQKTLIIIFIVIFISTLTVAQETRIVVASASPAMLTSYDLDGGDLDTLFIKQTTTYSFLAVDKERKKIYRTDGLGSTNRLVSLDYDGSNVTKIDSFTNVFVDIFFDSANDRLLYLLNENNHIFAYNMSDNTTDTLYNTLEQPRAVGYIASTNQIIWSANDLNEREVIAVDLNDSTEDTLYTVPSYIDGITIDEKSQSIILAADNQILKSNYDGSFLETLFSFESMEYPFDIILDTITNTLYWADYGVGEVRKGSLLGGDYTTLVTDLKVPTGIIFIERLVSSSSKFLDQDISVKMYPQPASSTVILELPSNVKWTSGKVINSQGQVILSFVPKERQEINVSSFPTGPLFVVMESNLGIITKKIVKN